MDQNRSLKALSPARFPGFEALDTNFIFCPNQFFDVCIPNCSRSAIRLIAYIVRQTLGWLDENGQLVEQDVSATYSQLQRHANISRRALRPAIDEALRLNFIECTVQPKAKAAGSAAQTGQYRMKWSDGEYTTSFKHFAGFYSGEGYRTPIPNSFFDYVVKTQKLNAIKVVASVLRHTVGYQSQFGGRRRVAELSYDRLQSFANIKHRPTLAAAVRASIDNGFICRVRDGVFDKNGGINSQAALYSPNWLAQAQQAAISVKNEPASNIGAKSELASEQNSNRLNKAKSEPNKKTFIKNSDKQFVADLVDRLIEQGIARRTANQLIEKHEVSMIKNQLDWLDYRKVDSNRTGLLVTAIKGNWKMPPELRQKIADEQVRKTRSLQHEQQINSTKNQQQQIRDSENDRLMRYQQRLLTWQQLTTQQQETLLKQAANAATNGLAHQKIIHSSLDHPVAEILEHVDSLDLRAFT